MSKCSVCPDPGICCRKFIVESDLPWAYTAIETKKTVIKRLKDLKLPFKPIKKGKRRWVLGCTKLKDGKCTIYSDRPKLCRGYRPGTGRLCCLSKKYGGEITGD